MLRALHEQGVSDIHMYSRLNSAAVVERAQAMVGASHTRYDHLTYWPYDWDWHFDFSKPVDNSSEG